MRMLTAVPAPTPTSLATRPEILAFLHDAESETIVRRALHASAPEPDAVRRGRIGQAINHLKEHRSPNSLVVDISDIDLPLSSVRELAEVCEPGVNVVVVGNRGDIGLYRDLMHLGVSDYIVKPLNEDLVQRAVQFGVAGANPDTISQKLGKAVAVMGTRGGVGTTTIAVNLAWHLAYKQGRRVALVDFDLQTGDCGLMLDVKSTTGLREALENSYRIDKVFLDRVMTARGERLFVLSAEESLRDELRFEPRSAETLIAALQSEFHYVIIDMPRVASAINLRAIELSPIRIVVADETIRSAREVVRLRSIIGDGQGAQRNFLVINRSGERRPGYVGKRDFVEAVEMRVHLTIPHIANIGGGIASYGPPPAAGKGPMAQAVAALAAEMSGRPAPTRKWWAPWR